MRCTYAPTGRVGADRDGSVGTVRAAQKHVATTAPADSADLGDGLLLQEPIVPMIV